MNGEDSEFEKLYIPESIGHSFQFFNFVTCALQPPIDNKWCLLHIEYR